MNTQDTHIKPSCLHAKTQRALANSIQCAEGQCTSVERQHMQTIKHHACNDSVICQLLFVLTFSCGFYHSSPAEA